MSGRIGSSADRLNTDQAFTDGRGATDGDGPHTDHQDSKPSKHSSSKGGKHGGGREPGSGTDKGLHCKKESMKKVPNGKSELELQELDPKRVRRILANRQVCGTGLHAILGRVVVWF